MNRRSFLGSILAAGMAPAFVGSSVLMPVRRILTGDIAFNGPWANVLNPVTGEYETQWPSDHIDSQLILSRCARRMLLVKEMVMAGALGYRSIGSPEFNAKLLEWDLRR